MLTCGKLVVTFLLIGGIIWYLEDLGELGSLITRIKPFYVLLILFVNTLDRALMSFKWSWLLRSRNQPLPFFQGLKIYCASMVWGMLLPATIRADAFRAYSASRTGLDANEIVASILIERIAGFLSALLLGLLSLVLFFLYGGLDHRFYIVWWLGSVMLVGATVVFAASFNQSTFDLLHGHLLSRFQDTQIVQRLRQFHTIYRAYRHDKGSLAVFFGLTFSEQFIAIPLMWLVARGLGIEVGFLSVAGVVPLAFLISQFPISINGLGVFDGAFMLLMSFIGVPGVEASAIVILGRILETASWLPWWGAQVFSNTTR